MPTRLSLRIEFDGDRRLGPGKVALLEAIRRNGSIAAAGREFGMAYRRAWLLVDEMNRMFSGPLVETKGGGKNGGGAALTQLGSEIAALYRVLETKTMRAGSTEIRRLEQLLSPIAPDLTRPDSIQAS